MWYNHIYNHGCGYSSMGYNFPLAIGKGHTRSKEGEEEEERFCDWERTQMSGLIPTVKYREIYKRTL